MGVIRDFFARREIKSIFGAYVSPSLVDERLKAERTDPTRARTVELSPYFCNLHGYMGLAEQVPLERLPELMNGYFTICTDEISAMGGTVNKFIGDSVVAMFGAPVALQDHALRACVAALKTQLAIAAFRDRLKRDARRWPESVHRLRVRIGINSGSVIVGNMGTKTRFNFTMLGDEVNLAARLESGAKSWGAWTICSGATKRACERAEPGRVLFRSLGEIIVKGRADSMEIFEPVAFSALATDAVRECIALFERGLARYREKNWNGAIELFVQSAPLEPNRPGVSPGIERNPSTVFLDSANKFQQGVAGAPNG